MVRQVHDGLFVVALDSHDIEDNDDGESKISTHFIDNFMEIVLLAINVTKNMKIRSDVFCCWFPKIVA